MNAAAPFAGLERTPAVHLRLGLIGAAARLADSLAHAEPGALDTFPFLRDYLAESAGLLGRPDADAEAFRAALLAWEAAAGPETPLRRLAAAGLSPDAREMLLAVALVEEDPRFGDLFAELGHQGRRPTLGVLRALWRDQVGETSLAALLRLGLVRAADETAPRPDWAIAVPGALWEALHGRPPALGWLWHTEHADLPDLGAFVTADRLRCHALPELLATEAPPVLVIRGTRSNGRRTLIGAVARALGRGLLVANQAAAEDPVHWSLLTVLSLLLHALPGVHLDLSPGETRTLPPQPFAALPLAVLAGPRGSVVAPDGRAQVTITLPLPDPVSRRVLWARALPDQPDATIATLADAARLPAGAIARIAPAALQAAHLAGRAYVTQADLRDAARSLQPARLETVATRLDASGAPEDLAVDEPTRAELDLLTARCRHREALGAAAPEGERQIGVRALLSGPSGTGKTLAARLLAATLGRDLWRLDLSAAVSKYIGETEKNLETALAAAEELDIVLLLDEGDALMAPRTEVGSANDRYANLETNFLLQRIETFSGILLVTSNAAERIDKAFARRMDVVIPFRLPDEHRRWEILRRHLPGPAPGEAALQEVAWRCALTGGQLRNVAQHARLLALHAARDMTEADLRNAVAREYRKTGTPCPLKPAANAA